MKDYCLVQVDFNFPIKQCLSRSFQNLKKVEKVSNSNNCGQFGRISNGDSLALFSSFFGSSKGKQYNQKLFNMQIVEEKKKFNKVVFDIQKLDENLKDNLEKQ